MRLIVLLFACGIALVALDARAHDENVHVRISASAFHSSIGLSNFLTLYFGGGIASFDNAPLLLTRATDEPGPITNSPLAWLGLGSYLEDMQDPILLNNHFLRSSDHFYTVTPSRGVGEATGLTENGIFCVARSHHEPIRLSKGSKGVKPKLFTLTGGLSDAAAYRLCHPNSESNESG